MTVRIPTGLQAAGTVIDAAHLVSLLLRSTRPDGALAGTAGTALHGTKVPVGIWLNAATIFAAAGGKVRLRDLQQTCGTSYKTTWRMRSVLRDAAAILSENREAR